MLFLVYTPDGEILRSGRVPKEWVNSQAASNELLLTDEDVSSDAIQQVITQGNKAFYIDQRTILPTPPCPQDGCTFNYVDKQWDLSSAMAMEKFRAQAINKINQARLEIETRGFMSDGKLFDSSPTSQLRINAAALSASNDPTFHTDWKLADNSVVQLNSTQMQQVAQSLWAHMLSCYTQTQQFKQRVAQANSYQEINSVSLDVDNWLGYTVV